MEIKSSEKMIENIWRNLCCIHTVYNETEISVYAKLTDIIYSFGQMLLA